MSLIEETASDCLSCRFAVLLTQYQYGLFTLMIAFSYWAALKALRVFQIEEYSYVLSVWIGGATFVVLTIGGWYDSVLLIVRRRRSFLVLVSALISARCVIASCAAF